MKSFDLRLRSSRRIAVVAHYGSFLLTLAWYALVRKLHNFSDPMAWTQLALVMIYLISGLMLISVSWPYGISGRHWKASIEVDERQRQVRADALAYSYWLTSSMVMIAFLWIAAADFSRGPSHLGVHLWRPVNARQWWWVFWIGVMVNSMFPAALIAWNESDMLVDSASESEIPAGLSPHSNHS